MYKTINFDALKLDRHRNKINIFDGELGESLYFQLSKGFVNRKITNESKYLWIGYYVNSKGKQQTFDTLKQFKKILEDRLDIKIENFYYDNGIGLFLQNHRDNVYVKIFMRQNQKIWEKNLDDLVDKFYVIPVIHIDCIICRDNKWYLNNKLVQMIVYPLYNVIDKCVLDDNVEYLKDSNDTNISSDFQDDIVRIKALDHPSYGKYFKMLNMGVPKMAVIIKIRSELGIDGTEILEQTEFKVHKIRAETHKTFGKYFKMIKMGIPRMAVAQKMNSDGFEDGKEICLDAPEALILDLEISVKNDLVNMILSKKLKKKDHINNNTNSNTNINNSSGEIILVEKPKLNVMGINLDELMKRRQLILKN
jgi:hypothetical protein